MTRDAVHRRDNLQHELELSPAHVCVPHRTGVTANVLACGRQRVPRAECGILPDHLDHAMSVHPAGREAEGKVRRRRSGAGDADNAAREVETPLRVLLYMGRLAITAAAATTEH